MKLNAMYEWRFVRLSEVLDTDEVYADGTEQHAYYQKHFAERMQQLQEVMERVRRCMHDEIAGTTILVRREVHLPEGPK